MMTSADLPGNAAGAVLPPRSRHRQACHPARKVAKQNHKDSPDKSVNVDWTITINAAGKAEQGKTQ
jgi:hypothetical protein